MAREYSPRGKHWIVLEPLVYIMPKADPKQTVKAWCNPHVIPFYKHFFGGLHVLAFAQTSMQVPE